MTRMRFALGAMFLLIAAPATFGACGGDEPSSDPKIRYCEQRCACDKCSEEDTGLCKDDIINLQDLAKSKDCNTQFDAYVECLLGNGTCADGSWDESFCVAEEKDVNSCIKPPPACMTVKDGVCNEPAPKGDDTCAAGTDTEDCMAPPMCTTTEDGYCDEPGGNGSGTCAPGSDALDCACAYTNNGQCDEPEGTGYCLEGYDATDCMPAACSTCGEYLADPLNAPPMCSTSSSKYSAYFACACDSASLCYTPCSTNLCYEEAPTSTCTTCSSCSTQYSQCMSDTGI